MEDNFSMDWGGEDGLGIIQAHYIYCALCCYHYYISSTSDHHTLDPGGWGPLVYLKSLRWGIGGAGLKAQAAWLQYRLLMGS